MCSTACAQLSSVKAFNTAHAFGNSRAHVLHKAVRSLGQTGHKLEFKICDDFDRNIVTDAVYSHLNHILETDPSNVGTLRALLLVVHTLSYKEAVRSDLLCLSREVRKVLAEFENSKRQELCDAEAARWQAVLDEKKRLAEDAWHEAIRKAIAASPYAVAMRLKAQRTADRDAHILFVKNWEDRRADKARVAK